jgi:hypothetical protein
MLRISLVLMMCCFTLGCTKIRPNAGKGEACKTEKGFGVKKSSNCKRGLLCRSGKCTKDAKLYDPNE